jgi:cell division transport system permease protein
MTKAAHVLGEFARNLVRYPWTALGSLLSLALLFLLFDLYWIGAGTFDRVYDSLLADLRMEAFVSEDVDETQIPELQAAVASVEGVADIQYVSKADARESMATMLGTDLLVGYDTLNPLPRSFVVTIYPAYLNSADMVAMADQIKSMPAISDLYYGKEWLQKSEDSRAVILRVGLALGIFIVLTALISSINNIRLMARGRAEGLQQMRLLGAGKLFLALPVVMEGFLIGGLAALIGWLLILYGRSEITFTQFEIVLPATVEIAAFCVATGLLGVVSGYLGIRKWLK